MRREELEMKHSRYFLGRKPPGLEKTPRLISGMRQTGRRTSRDVGQQSLPEEQEEEAFVSRSSGVAP